MIESIGSGVEISTLTSRRKLIRDIAIETLEDEASALAQRWDDLKKAESKRSSLCYPAVLKYCQHCDSLFLRKAPIEYYKMFLEFGIMSKRWNETEKVAQTILGQLREADLGFGGKFDYRAKSNFSCLAKTVGLVIPPKAVLDLRGVRIMVGTIPQARNVKDYFLGKYGLVDVEAIHPKLSNPLKDTFDLPRKDGFSHIRMNLVYPGIGPFELQVEAYERYKSYGYREMMAALFYYCSSKFGFHDPA